MIKSIRKRLIISAMIIVFLIVFSLELGACITIYQNQYHALKNTLASYQSFNWGMSSSLPGPGGFDLPPRKEQGGAISFNDSFIPAVIVTLNSDGSILQVFEKGMTIEESTLEEQVQIVLSSKKTEGNTLSHSLYFGTSSNNGTNSIIFLSTYQITETMKTVLILCACILVISLLFFFGVICFVANVALKPVEKSWNQQKQFVADASHDLKTPLTVILANMSILEGNKEATIESQEQWVDSTKEEAIHMKKLVQSLLDLAKTDSLEKELEISEVNLGELTESIILQMEAMAFEKEIIMDSDEIVSDLTFRTNTESYTILLKTLLENAIRYSPEKSEIKIALTTQKNSVVLSIHNFGEPIPKEDLPHIFDRFYRSDKSRTTEGHGLGLAICKNLADALNGKIRCDSSEENGTTFTVTFSK